MNIEKTQIDELTYQFTLKIEAEDYAVSLKKKLNEKKRTAELKGFRKGMAPMSIIDRIYGDQALYESVNEAVASSMDTYIAENKLRVVGEPLPSENQPENTWQKGQSFTFKFDLAVTEEVTLDLGKEDSVPYYRISITPQAKDEMKENMLRQLGSMEEGEAAGEDDIVIADLSQADKNVQEAYISVGNAEGEAHSLFLGAKVGDEFDIDVTATFTNEVDRAAMLRIKKEELAGIDPLWHVKVVNVKTFVSAQENRETYDKLFGEGKVTNSEEFDAAVTERLEHNYTQESDFRLSKDLKEYMINKAAVKLPETFLKRWLIHVNEGKFTPEDVEKDFPDFLEDFRWRMVRSSLMSKYGLKVEKDDIRAAAESYAAYQYTMYGMLDVPSDMIKDYATRLLAEDRQSERFAEQVEAQKVIAAAKEAVSLEEKTISVEDFRELK